PAAWPVGPATATARSGVTARRCCRFASRARSPTARRRDCRTPTRPESARCAGGAPLGEPQRPAALAPARGSRRLALRAAMREAALEFVGGHRRREQEALPLVASDALQEAHLLFVLDALRDHSQPEAAGEPGDRAHDR